MIRVSGHHVIRDETIIADSPSADTANEIASALNTLLGISDPAALRKETVEVLELLAATGKCTCAPSKKASWCPRCKAARLADLWRAQGRGE